MPLSRSLLLAGFFGVVLPSCLLAQSGAPQSCAHVHVTASAIVRGYTFKTYESTNPDDGACLRIYRGGKVVYSRASDDVEQYSLGQPKQAEYKIPFIPNGADLTGEGRPDMIVTSWSGGAHCCFTRYIFELEPKLRLLATIEDGDTDLGHFERLDQTSGYFYVTQDIWSYWPESFASSVSHRVILRWDGTKFRLDLSKMRRPALTPDQWKKALQDVNGALKEEGDVRGALGVTLWDTVLDLIYSGHSDLAWKFVSEVPPAALQGNNASLGEFCLGLKGPYENDLRPTLKDVPEECEKALRSPAK